MGSPPEIPTGYTVFDIILSVFYSLVLIIVATSIRNANVDKHPHFRYIVGGLVVKIIGAASLCSVYLFYYGGGDTLGYFYNGNVLARLFFKEPLIFFRIVFLRDCTRETFSYFTHETGEPYHWFFSDPLTYFIPRFISVFEIISFENYLATSILITAISYTGLWKLYTVFVEEFPELKKEMAIAVLFVPSVFFWGSGILKDPITISAVGWYTYAFYHFFVKKRFRLSFIIYLVVSSYIMLAIKPYIFYALIPGSLVWSLFDFLKRVKGGFMKVAVFPMFLAVFFVIGYFVLTKLGSDKGNYSLSYLMEYSTLVNIDLKKVNFGASSFDLGDYDPTISGMLSKAPQAINAALFRPYLWEVKNVIMLISALENTVILFLVIQLIIKMKFLKTMVFIAENPLQLFCVFFVLLFSFSVGVTTSNFGSLVRYKIPAMPFFIASIFIMRYYNQKEREAAMMGTKK